MWKLMQNLMSKAAKYHGKAHADAHAKAHVVEAAKHCCRASLSFLISWGTTGMDLGNPTKAL